jgi:phage terminase small subunit
MSLNARQLRFVDEYLIDLNATQAAIRAGYSAKTAGQIGSRLLKDVEIMLIIETKRAQLTANAGLSQERVVGELVKIGFSDMSQFAAWGPDGVTMRDSAALPAGATACIAEVSETITEAGGTKRFKLHDKVQALITLGKHLGLFPDRHELTGKNGGPVQVAASEWRFGDRVIRFGAAAHGTGRESPRVAGRN